MTLHDSGLSDSMSTLLITGPILGALPSLLFLEHARQVTTMVFPLTFSFDWNTFTFRYSYGNFLTTLHNDNFLASSL